MANTKSRQGLQTATLEEQRSLPQRAADYLFGYDFFISYAWADGRAYALALAQELQGMGFECFLDSKDYAFGDNWRIAGRRAIRKTSRLILVGSPRALTSEPVLREFEAFKRTSRRVEPIDFGGSLFPANRTAPLFEYLSPEVLTIREEQVRLTIGPSLETLQKLRSSFEIQRQDKKRLRWISIVALVLAMLLAATVVAYLAFENQRQQTQRQRLEAETQSQEAERQKLEAERQSQEAEKQRLEAERQGRKAERQRLEAEKQRDTALARQAERDRQAYFRSVPLAVEKSMHGHFEASRKILTSLAPSEINWEWTYAYVLADPSLYTLTSTSRSSAIPGYPFSLSFDQDGRLNLLNTATGQEIRSLGTLDSRAVQGPEKGQFAGKTSRRIAYSTDGGLKAQGHNDGTVVLSRRNETIVLVGHSDPVQEVEFSPDSSVLASRCGFEILPPDRSEPDDRSARLWRVSDGKLIKVLKDGDRAIEFLAFSPDSQHILTVHRDQIVRLWNSRTGDIIARLRGHEGNIRDAAFSPDGTVILTGDRQEVRIWPNRTAQVATPAKSLRLPERVFSPRNLKAPKLPGAPELEVQRKDKVLTLRERRDEQWHDVRKLSDHADELLHAAFSRNGGIFLGVFQSGRATVWDLDSGVQNDISVGGYGQRAMSASGHTEDLFAAVVLRDGRRLLTLSQDGLAKLWSVQNGECLWTIDWVRQRKPLAAGARNFHQTEFHRLSPDHRLIAIRESWNSGTPIQVWDLDTGRLLSLLKAEGRDLRTASFNSDGTRLVTASDVITRDYSTVPDPFAIVWDTLSGEQLLALRPEKNLKPVILRPEPPDPKEMLPGWCLKLDWCRSALYTDHFFKQNLEESIQRVNKSVSHSWFRNFEFSKDGGSIHAIAGDEPAYQAWTWKGIPTALLLDLESHTGSEALIGKWKAWRLVSYLDLETLYPKAKEGRSASGRYGTGVERSRPGDSGGQKLEHQRNQIVNYGR